MIMNKEERILAKVFSVYVQNLDAYSEGNIVGDWIDLPQKKEVIDRFLKEKVKIYNDNQEYEIADTEDYPFEYKIIQYADLHEINKLAVIYSLLDEVQIEAAKGYCKYNGKFDMDIQELLNVCMQSCLISYYQYIF